MSSDGTLETLHWRRGLNNFFLRWCDERDGDRRVDHTIASFGSAGVSWPDH